MRLVSIILLVLIFCGTAIGQVDQIKSSSGGRSRGGETSSGGSGAGFVFDLFFNVFIGEVIYAQQEKLRRRDEIPGLVSLDLMLQGAAQPSSYYILNPRVRANWALFSTDFRLNYIVEEDIEKMKHIRTNEWQILQFNIVTTEDALFRVGAGFIQEAYENRNYYSEWTTALQIHPANSRFGGFLEYRDSDMRKEINSYATYKLFDQKAFHGYLTGGVVYQRYFREVTTWGLQTGLIVRLY
ncbi:MAG TPA: hypothetical protein VD927_14105 [Chryseosolibacter sp.]|nr:hypothetical protein [Chryseosolibacter sp.]